jgi:hypothetical protein
MQKTGHLRREVPLDTVSLSNGDLGKTVYRYQSCEGVAKFRRYVRRNYKNRIKIECFRCRGF